MLSGGDVGSSGGGKHAKLSSTCGGGASAMHHGEVVYEVAEAAVTEWPAHLHSVVETVPPCQWVVVVLLVGSSAMWACRWCS